MSVLVSETYVKNIPIFSGLSGSDTQQISSIISVKNYPKNTIIIDEGDDTNSLFLINTGKVKILMSDEDGKEVILSILEPEDYFGELSLIDAQERSARVMCMTPCQFFVITKSDFNNVLEKNLKIALNLLKGLATRIRAADENIVSLALMDVCGRVARILLQYSKEIDGERVITEKLTQKDIANMAGAFREMVNRIFKDLTIGGYISIERWKYPHQRKTSGWLLKTTHH